jgi:hypothetical protein
MVSNGSKWLLIAHNDLNWQKMVENGQDWPEMVRNSLQQFEISKIALNSPNCFETVQSGTKWCKQDLNGPK